MRTSHLLKLPLLFCLALPFYVQAQQPAEDTVENTAVPPTNDNDKPLDA